jgi:hypothetical protein
VINYRHQVDTVILAAGRGVCIIPAINVLSFRLPRLLEAKALKNTFFHQVQLFSILLRGGKVKKGHVQFQIGGSWAIVIGKRLWYWWGFRILKVRFK